MPLYSYKVRDKSGKVLKGQMAALDGRDLRKKLDDKNYFIVDFTEKKAKRDLLSLELFPSSKKVTYKDMSVFGWQLFTMLDAGLTLINSLKIIEGQAKNELLKSALNDVWHRVEEGASFSQSLGEHPKVFPELFIQMVSAGEVGGVLDEMLRRLAVYYERQDEILSKIKSALTYPSILVVVSIAVIIFMLTFILPQFSSVFEDMGVAIPVLTRVLLALSSFVKDNWQILLLIPVVLFMVFVRYVSSKAGRYKIDKLKLRIPIFGELLQKTMAARFTQTLSTLISSGIPILTALDVVTGTIGNVVITKTLKDVSVMVGEGKPMAKPLEESGIFPEMVVSMIKVGEETGALDKMLEKISQFYYREVDNAIEVFTKLMEPVLIVLMTVVIGGIAISIFLPMADIMRGAHV